jgi:hypothetical protein
MRLMMSNAERFEPAHRSRSGAPSTKGEEPVTRAIVLSGGLLVGGNQGDGGLALVPL